MWRDDQKRLSHTQPPSVDHPWGVDFMENSSMCPLTLAIGSHSATCGAHLSSRWVQLRSGTNYIKYHMLSKNGHKLPLAATSSTHLHPAQSSAFTVLSMAHCHCPARYCQYQYRQYRCCSSLSHLISPPLPYSRPDGGNHFNCIFHDFSCILVVSSY